MKMNVLLTCSGRRNYLVDYFRDFLQGDGKVYTMNSTMDAVSMIESDGAIQAPPVYDPEYIEFLLDVCRYLEIGLLISLFDLELPFLAEKRKRFEDIGVCLAVSGEDVIAICADKLESNRFLKNLQLDTLFTTTSLEEADQKLIDANTQKPFYIKPRWGMGSLAIQRASTREELHILFDQVRRHVLDSHMKHHKPFERDACVVIQEKATGTEYGLDVVNDLEGNYVTTFVKRKAEMRFGETQIAVIDQIPELVSVGEKIGKALRHKGILDVDLFWDGNSPVILEMNARFGGGYPFSHLAGANLPAAYLNWAAGKDVPEKYLRVQNGTKGFKGFKMIRGDALQPIKIT